MTGRRSRRATRSRTPLYAAAGLAVAAAAAGAVAAFSGGEPGSNGVAGKPGPQIAAAARRAALAAPSVHVTGAVVSGREVWQLDLRLARGGADGQVSYGKRTFKLRRAGEDLYLKADSDIYRSGATPRPGPSASAGAESAKRLADAYVPVPKSDPLYTRLSRFTDKTQLLTAVLELRGTVAAGEDTADVRGRETLPVAGDGGRGGTLQVAVDGAPYPLRYGRGSAAGTLDLYDYGRPVPTAAPPKSQILDYRKPADG